jgi:hypothetical protein
MKKIKYFFYLVIAFLGFYTEGVAQVAINTDGSPAGTNTILDLNPAVGKAFVPPKMTWAQIKSISPASEGMVVYDIEFKCLRMYNGTKWICVGEQKQLTDPPGSFTTLTNGGPDWSVLPIAVVTDASGNVYVTGNLSNTVTFGTLPPITSLGGPVNNADIFIVKYNSSGIAQWVQRAGGTNDDLVFDIALDASGNIYITGAIYGTATFGTLPPLTPLANSDIFVAKYNNSGTAIWAKRAGGAGTHYSGGYAIALDATNNIYIVGEFGNTANFGSTVSITSTGSSDIFIAKYDNDGTALWAQKAGGVMNDYAADLALDASGNIYIVGTFKGTASFGTTLISTAGTTDEVYIAKYNNNGAPQWAQRTGATKINSEESNPSIALDALGNIYISGEFTGTATFGTLTPITSVGSYDVFLAKYTNTGTPIWVQRAGGVYTDYPCSIALDASGNIYFTVMFEGSATFGTLPTIYAPGGYNPNAAIYDNFDVCIVKYNSNGTPLWVQKGGGAKHDFIYGVTVDVSGNVYTVGAFHPTAQFGNQIFTSGSMFLMKYSE